MGIISGLKIFAVLAILSIIGGSIMYVVNLKADLVTSEANNEKLNDVVKSQIIARNKMIIQITEIRIIEVGLREKNRIQTKEMNELNERFNIKANGESRDFGKIARAKPKIIERIVNKGTKNVNRCFELITGAELEEGEKNNECQKFIDSISN